MVLLIKADLRCVLARYLLHGLLVCRRLWLCPGAHIIVTWFSSDSAVSFSIQSAISSDFCSAHFWDCGCHLPVSTDWNLLLTSFFLKAASHTVQYCRNLCLKAVTFFPSVSLYFTLILASPCLSPLLISGFICKSDLPFSQLSGLFFLPLLVCYQG